jgi:hypothetical protein
MREEAFGSHSNQITHGRINAHIHSYGCMFVYMDYSDRGSVDAVVFFRKSFSLR